MGYVIAFIQILLKLVTPSFYRGLIMVKSSNETKNASMKILEIIFFCIYDIRLMSRPQAPHLRD